MMEKFKGYLKMERKKLFLLMELREKYGQMVTPLSSSITMMLSKHFQMERQFTISQRPRQLKLRSQMDFKFLNSLTLRQRSTLLMEQRKFHSQMEL